MNIFNILVPKHMLTYLNYNDSLEGALDFMLASGYTAVPVIDDAGKYVGIVSEGDFLRAVIDYGKENLNKYTVSQIANLDKDGSVLNTVDKAEIMEKILDRNFLSVVDDRQCFVGIITRKSIIQYLKKEILQGE